MSKLHLGRFNMPALGAVYVSREPTTAVEELRRRAARDGLSLTAMHPRSIFVLALSLHAILALTRPDALATWGLAAADLDGDDVSRCQGVATVAVQHGAEAVRWASATGKGESLALFVEHLLPGSSVTIEDELTAVAERARVCGVPVARYIREAALGASPRARRTQANAELIRQLTRIGNNLNQLARAANTGAQCGGDPRLRLVVEDVIAIIKRVE